MVKEGLPEAVTWKRRPCKQDLCLVQTGQHLAGTRAWRWQTWMTQAFTLEPPSDWPRKHRQFCFPGGVLV